MTKFAKRCPGCGGEGALGFTSSAVLGWFGRCTVCGFTSSPGATPTAARASWQEATVVNDQQGPVTIPNL